MGTRSPKMQCKKKLSELLCTLEHYSQEPESKTTQEQDKWIKKVWYRDGAIA